MVQTCTVMAPPCSSLRLSVFLMFCLTCECREDRLLFKTWNERSLLVIGARGGSVAPSKRGPFHCHGARRVADSSTALWNCWDSAGGWVTQTRAARGNCWEDLGARGFGAFAGLLTSNCGGHLQLPRSHPPLRQRPLYLDHIQSPANVALSYHARLKVLWYLEKSACFNRCTYITFPVDYSFLERWYRCNSL